MPHRCMNCGNTYEDDSEELIDGCECGSSLFIYENEPEEQELSEDEKTEVRSDIEEMVEEGLEERENIKFKFDLDSIVVEEEGVYNINVSRLLKEVPLVIRKTEGVYHVHLPSAFTPESREIDSSELDIT
ncbi:MAG: hypothetical protein BRC29_04510 [Nanohaloarchaea archaeon SW_7_43_1]|nr:MAG: hypothetical protein BRC29_04510 [Nanohaloarchaea archaeon SW_7_43_1]